LEKLNVRRTSRRGIINTGVIDKILDMSIRDFTNKYRPPSTTYITIRRGTKIYNVLKALATGHPVIVIVIDENRRPIGYLTDYHILMSFHRRPRPRSILASFSMSQMTIPIEKSLDIPVDNIMDKRPPVMSMEKKVRDAIRAFKNLGVPAIILVDENNIVRGVLERRFLIKTILNSLLGEPLMF
jgi:predicted transcriptional regulator